MLFPGANNFFKGGLDKVLGVVDGYLTHGSRAG